MHTEKTYNLCLVVTATMSTVTINMYSSGETAQMRASAGKRKRKNKWFLRKKQKLEQKGQMAGKQKHNHQGSLFNHNQPPRHNREFSKYPKAPTSLPVGTSQSFSSSGSTQSLPSYTVTVNNKEDPKKPKEPMNTKSATAAPGTSSRSNSWKPTTAGTSAAIPAKCFALDCEMVGAGPKGSISQLGRCSIVSYEGDVVYDKFIKPAMPVTDYRTRWSGIRRSDMANATPFSEARKEILKLLMGKVVIGHAVHNDFKVLSYSHPAALTRDTSRIPLLNRRAGFAESECASLKRLTKAILNRDIQTGRRGHSSVEDAKATMELYKVVEEELERSLAAKQQKIK
ncbi:interferon-stimulated 20 kDa exonuclease-like 2 [Echeneis naucrates]|uniref:Interferon-stimulated 20 kDa exonuclease-like 2 n=1 Tax=Echeneis naucrates TaxID=173247 RepID=A0A665T9G6_ECHNA|nr:interferon-stimulated 20 kDa exonuclease-like 2 [Echeneis naucrates]XP_029360624.1 interferon-stimulated 20 kDa exonuclease-like 2 [Echeneis naucrates]XP_029360625.1 interferon-stimulated 20 kDa exonuclease-like 2 [Echeneis naucrates]